MLEFIRQPWSWYVAGILVGLTVPVLLFLGNKKFGISATLRHTCAACVPADISFFQYNWKNEMWNMFFVVGTLIGGIVATFLLSNPEPIQVSEATVADLQALGVTDFGNLLPADIFSWESLFTLRGFMFIVVGGFMVGFGARWAGGCTSGHAIMGIASLQVPSLIATISFMVGGFIMTNLLLGFFLGL
ncbi:MAG: YeeE/YedE family protein [Bernardetiaceae bacterium]|nr:YeeE/YedE family protein [Bernardetiaceae bacterium]